MKNIFNNKKIYILTIIIITIIYLFLIYGGIQKGITQTHEKGSLDSIDAGNGFNLPVKITIYDTTTILVYNILIMIIFLAINILAILFSNKRKLKIGILLLFIALSLTLVPIKMEIDDYGYRDISHYLYNSCTINTDSYSTKWPIVRNLFD